MFVDVSADDGDTAAGLGLLRVTRSIWGFGLLLAAFVWYLNASLIPWSVEEARETREGMQRAADVRKSAGSVGPTSLVTKRASVRG